MYFPLVIIEHFCYRWKVLAATVTSLSANIKADKSTSAVFCTYYLFYSKNIL